MTTAVITIPSCSICGGSRIETVLARSLTDFLGTRSAHYDLHSLGLQGTEVLGYVRCRDCSFVFASPTLDASLEIATYNEAKATPSASDEFREDGAARQLYETYHKWVDLLPFTLAMGWHAHRFSRPRNFGREPLRLLDIGCGYGHTLELARVFGVDAFGCDLDETRLAQCRRKGLSVGKPSSVAGVYDLIVSSNVIEHVYDIHGYIQLVERSLANGGVFVFNGLEESVIKVELRKQRFKLLHPIEHRNVFTRASLVRLLSAHGLRLVTRRELLTVMRTVRSRAPLYLPYAVRGGFVSLNGVFSAIARRP